MTPIAFFRQAGFLIILLLVVFACRQHSDPKIEITETNSIAIAVSSVTPMTERKPTEDDSRSTHGSPTVNNVVSPTVIQADTIQPQPTLSSEEKIENLMALMDSQTWCRLPCWWSFVPGESTIKSARELLEPYGFLWGTDDTARIRASNIVLFLQFLTDGERIQSITVGSDDMSAFSDTHLVQFDKFWEAHGINRLLRDYGSPSQVFVYHPYQFDSGGGPAYHLVLSYQDQGFVIEYGGSGVYLGGNVFKACPKGGNISGIRLHLFSPGTRENLISEILPPESLSHIAGPDTVYDLINWEGATGTSLEAFGDLFKIEGSEACFEFTSR
jgi:hypothetical protein